MMCSKIITMGDLHCCPSGKIMELYEDISNNWCKAPIRKKKIENLVLEHDARKMQIELIVATYRAMLWVRMFALLSILTAVHLTKELKRLKALEIMGMILQSEVIGLCCMLRIAVGGLNFWQLKSRGYCTVKLFIWWWIWMAKLSP